MRVTLIHNPKAGDDAQPSAGQLAALIREAGHKCRVQSIREKHWSKILKKEVDLIAVAGGDGTIGKVGRRLVGSDCPMAVLPLGTANNISRTLGVFGMSPFQFIAGWEKARVIRFDVGTAAAPWGERYFIESVGAGLFSHSMPHLKRNKTLESLADADVKVTYALQLLRERLEKLRPLPLKATLDGRDISGKYLLVEAMNIRHIGPNLFLAPHVGHSAGFLDVVFITEARRRKLARYLARWQEGKLWPHEFGVARGKRLEIEWTGFPLHLDDKLWPKPDKAGVRRGTISIGLKRGALRFLVPRQPASVIAAAR